jgi:hypothetical protein
MRENRLGVSLDSSMPPCVEPSPPNEIHPSDEGLTDRGILQPSQDWLSRLLEMVPVQGLLDLR